MDHAQEVFSTLASIDRRRISFHVTGRDQIICVPRLAWSEILHDLPRYEVVFVEVDDDKPPMYVGKTQSVVLEKESPMAEKMGVVGWFRALFGRRSQGHS